MGKIVVTEFVSLDGVFEAPGPDGSGFKHEGWTMPFGNEEFMEFKLSELKTADALLLGRITYEGFAKAWPGRHDDEGFADKFNSMPKYVVSSSLKITDWNNSHIINENIIEEIKKLKKEYSTDIMVSGSGQLVRFLAKNNLVDQYNLMVYPLVLGEGRKLFGDDTKIDLKLVESKTLKTGVVTLIYTPIASSQA